MLSADTNFDQLKRQVAQLPPSEQLKLLTHICEQLTAASFVPKTSVVKHDISLRQQETDKLLALCDAAAEMWEGDFDAAEDIRQMRKERDEQIGES